MKKTKKIEKKDELVNPFEGPNKIISVSYQFGNWSVLVHLNNDLRTFFVECKGWDRDEELGRVNKVMSANFVYWHHVVKFISKIVNIKG